MNFNKLNEYVESLSQVGIPACEIVVTKDGKTVFHKCCGFSDGDSTKPTSENDLYWLFSASKVVTCTAVMRLVERGLISLDDKVSKYIPEYGNMMINNPDGTKTPASDMTIKHLFTMTGGMTYDKDTENIRLSSDKTTLGLVKAMAKDGLAFEPGTRYLYSLCHDVLAAVAEVVTGKKYSDYLKDEVFSPLGITDMGFHPTEDEKKRFSAMYRYSNGKGKSTLKKTENGFCLSPEYDSGGAGLYGTALSYSKIISALSLGGTASNGYQLLSKESVEAFKHNLLCDDALEDFSLLGDRFGYGWGLCGRVHINPTMSLSKSPVGEFGWDSAGGAYVLVDTENRISIFYSQHVMNCVYVYRVIHPRICNLTYEAIFDEENKK